MHLHLPAKRRLSRLPECTRSLQRQTVPGSVLGHLRFPPVFSLQEVRPHDAILATPSEVQVPCGTLSSCVTFPPFSLILPQIGLPLTVATALSGNGCGFSPRALWSISYGHLIFLNIYCDCQHIVPGLMSPEELGIGAQAGRGKCVHGTRGHGDC